MARKRHNSDNLERAKELRREMTAPEQRLWRILRDRRLAGLKFRRQFPIDVYIADFVCVEEKLVVEVDGMSHVGRFEFDQRREGVLREAGWRVVRVTNDDVLQNLEGVLTMIVSSAGLDAERWQNGEYGQLPEGSF